MSAKRQKQTWSWRPTENNITKAGTPILIILWRPSGPSPKESHDQGANNAGCEPPQPPLPNGSISHRGWPVLGWFQSRARPFLRFRRQFRFRVHFQSGVSKRTRSNLAGFARPHHESPDHREHAGAAQLFVCKPAPSWGGGAQELLALMPDLVRSRNGEPQVRL